MYKKISLISPQLSGGGAEKVLVNLGSGLVENNYIVDYVSLTGAKKPTPTNGIDYIFFENKRTISSAFKLFHYLKNDKPDVCISALTHINIICTIVAKLANFKGKLILTEHNNYQLGASRVSIIKRIITNFLIKILYPKSYKVVAVSNGVMESIFSVCKNLINLTVIYNPTIFPEIFIKMNEEVDEPWLREVSTNPVILGVGRLEKQKDFFTLIQSFSLLDKNTKLIILGEGSERQCLEKLVTDLKLSARVKFPGFVENPYNYMKHASVFVLSSIHEGLPGALIEAMACGTPVVSTNCPNGPAEILSNGKYGFLTPVGNELALSNAINATLKKPLDSLILTKRSEDFSVEHSVNKYIELIEA